MDRVCIEGVAGPERGVAFEERHCVPAHVTGHIKGQVIFALEVVVHAPVADPGALLNHLRTRRLEAALGRQRAGGRDQLLFRVIRRTSRPAPAIPYGLVRLPV